MNEILAFKLGKEFYGLEIDNVIEIIKKQDINRIPLPGECVKGVTSIRGNVATVFDLYKFLNIKPAGDEYFVICKDEETEKNMVFPVSDIVGILKKDEADNISNIDSIHGFVSSNIKYVYHHNNNLVLILDFDNLKKDIVKVNSHINIEQESVVEEA